MADLIMKPIIIAEDQKSLQRVFRRAVGMYCPGALVTVVDSGLSLVRSVQGIQYGLILTDNDMETQNNGLEAISEIRKMGEDMPIYMFSGNADPEGLAKKALTAGATGFYSKPFGLDVIKKILDEYQRN